MLPDPLARPDVARRLAAGRGIGLALAGGLVAVTASIAGVVHFALDGIPLAGNGVTIAGRSALSWVGAVIAVGAPVLAVAVGRAQARNGVKALAAEGPGGPDADADGLAKVFATGRFVEIVLAEGAGFLCALFYHFTADPLMLGLVAGLLAFIAFRLPTRDGFREWHDTAAGQLAEDRRLL